MRAGTADWNPLGELVGPGGKVVIKPNFVTSKNFEAHLEGDKLFCSSTHASVIRPLVDLARTAVGPTGRVSVVDSPIEGSNFPATVAELGMVALQDALNNGLANGYAPMELLDLRGNVPTRVERVDVTWLDPAVAKSISPSSSRSPTMSTGW